MLMLFENMRLYAHIYPKESSVLELLNTIEHRLG